MRDIYNCAFPPIVCENPKCLDCQPAQAAAADPESSVRSRVARERQRIRDLRALGIVGGRPRPRFRLRDLIAVLFR